MRVRILVSSPADNRSLIRPFGPPSPLRGEGWGRAAPCGRPYAPTRTFRGGRVRTPAPTAETDPGTLVRTTQAQEWNRSSGNFCKPRAQRPDEGIGPYKKRSIIATSSGPFGATVPIPSGLRPSPLDKGSRPPRGRLKRIGGEAPAEIQGESPNTAIPAGERTEKRRSLPAVPCGL